MKQLKIILISFSLIFSSAFACAESEFGNIQHGNFQTGGSFYFTQTFATSGAEYAYLGLSAPLEYFVMDHFSLGGRISLNHSFSSGSNNTTYALGPSASYYFWTQDRLAAFINVGTEFNRTYNSYNYFDMATRLGVNYFIVPSVAIAPMIQYYHAFSNDNIRAFNTISLLASFSIYL